MWPVMEKSLARYRELEEDLVNPEVIAQHVRYTRAAKEHASLGKLVKPYLEYQNLMEEISQTEALVASGDEEMSSLASEELASLTERKQALQERIEDLILIDPEEDFSSIIVEIRAGTGGDEAALFAGDLYNMYSYFARTQGWKIEEISFNPGEMGGYKEIVFSVSGDGVYQTLRFESGGHRVQRAPKTLDEWGSIIEYKVEYDDIGLPDDIIQTWKRYGVTATLYDGLVKEGANSVRKLMRSISGWRLRSGNYRFPIEQKLFHVYLKAIGKRDTEVYIRRDETSGVTPSPPA